jgi:hypothetical protein
LFARGAVSDHDRVAHGQMLDALAHGVDVAGSLVAKDNGERHAVSIERLDREVGVADSAGRQANPYLVRTGIIDDDIAENGGRTRLLQKHGLGIDRHA